MVPFIYVEVLVHWHQHFDELFAGELENLRKLMLGVLWISLGR